MLSSDVDTRVENISKRHWQFLALNGTKAVSVTRWPIGYLVKVIKNCQEDIDLRMQEYFLKNIVFAATY